MEAQDILDALAWRYAAKKYDTSKKVAEDTLHTILEAGRLSPSSSNTQPRTFVVVSNQEIKEKLSAHSGNPQVVECSHLVILCATTAYNEEFIGAQVALTAETR